MLMTVLNVPNESTASLWCMVTFWVPSTKPRNCLLPFVSCKMSPLPKSGGHVGAVVYVSRSASKLECSWWNRKG